MEGGPRGMATWLEKSQEQPACPPADFSILNHAALTEICSKLDGETLRALQLVNKETRMAATEDRAWREALKREFPYNFQQLDSAAASSDAPVPWRSEYARRVGVENRWQNGPMEQPSACVDSHTGPVFGASFLTGPLDSNLILTGGIDMDNSQGELFLWELDNINKSGSHTMRPTSLHKSPGILDSGIFSIRQRPGTSDVLCTTFGPNSKILRLQPCNSEETIDEKHNGGRDTAMMDTSNDHHELPSSHYNGNNNNTSSSLSSGDPSSSFGLLHLRGGGAGGEFSSQGNYPISCIQQQQQQDRSWELLPVYNLVGHTNGCSTSRISSSKVVTASFDGTVKLFSLPPSEETPLQGNTNTVPCISAAGTFQDDVLHYVTGVPAGVASPSAPVCGVDVSQDWTRMASGGNDMQLKLWDVPTGRIILRLPGHQGWIWNVDAEDEELNSVFTTCTDGRVRSWDLRCGVQSSCINLSQNYQDHVFPVSGVALRGAGRYMVVSSFDSLAYVVDRRTMRALYSMQGHTDRLSRVIVKEDTVLTLGFDGRVCRWDF